MLVLALKPFPFARRGTEIRQIVKGQQFECPEDIIPGLVAAGMIADPEIETGPDLETTSATGLETGGGGSIDPTDGAGGGADAGSGSDSGSDDEDEDEQDAEAKLAFLRSEWKNRTGEEPDGRWGIPKLTEEIEKLKAADQGGED